MAGRDHDDRGCEAPDRRDLADPRPEVTGAEPQVIQRLFDDVAPTYDLLNRVLSVGLDGRWRDRTAALLRPEPGDLLVDVCGGTGDLALAVQRQYPECRVLLTDFAQEMLRRALPKVRVASAASPMVVSADACRLPLRDGSCSGYTVAWGIRNLRSARAGLEEARRVLKPSGRLAILEFLRPTGAFGWARSAGLRALVPPVVWCVARRHAGAYRYLVRSIMRFLSVAEMGALLEECGFTDIEVHPQLLGIATIVGATRR
jgi:demethylmenaquinone methyltransferase/2-methoxy-6-polyprenyl-1,4-benzoquinol methylase